MARPVHKRTNSNFMRTVLLLLSIFLISCNTQKRKAVSHVHMIGTIYKDGILVTSKVKGVKHEMFFELKQAKPKQKMKLPYLKGSPGQCKWALGIRREAVDYAIEFIGTPLSCVTAAKRNGCLVNVNTDAEAVAFRSHAINVMIESIPVEAKYWIENRNMDEDPEIDLAYDLIDLMWENLPREN